METQSCLRLRLVFDDPSLLTQAQRSEGMNHSWILIEPNQHPKISDVCNHLQRIFNLRASCSNGIHLFMEEFVLPPSESTRILKDKDIICLKRKGMALAEAIEGADACNLLDDGEANKREPVDNGMLLLANEEFDKETGGYKSESEEEKWEEEPSPKEAASKKRKASTKLQSLKKKKKRPVVMDNVEDEVATEDDHVNNDLLLPMKLISKKIKTKNAKKNDESETIIIKVKSPSEGKRKKKHRLGLLNGAEDEVVIDEIDKKKTQPNQETNKANGETSGKHIRRSPNEKRVETLQDKVKGPEEASTAPNEATKVPSRSARRKKAKRQWRRELAKLSQQPDNRLEPEVSKSENKEANGHTAEASLQEDQVPVKIVHEKIREQGETNHNDIRDTEHAPRVVRPGHIRFEPLDEGDDAQETQVPDVAFEWNGITSKKKGQKWGIEKTSTSRRDDSEKASKDPSPMLTADTQVPSVDLNDCDQLPICSSPKEGDVIAYRVLELSSSWTPELSSFRVGKISYYDANNIILMPVPEYPIVFDNMNEDAPGNSLYKEDGSLEIKFAALADVRSIKQSNSDAMKAVSNGFYLTPQADKKKTVSNATFSNGNKANLSKDPSPVVSNKEGNTWEELSEALNAKKSELLEINEEMKRDSGWNKWSYRALRGSALGPTMALLRSKNI